MKRVGKILVVGSVIIGFVISLVEVIGWGNEDSSKVGVSVLPRVVSEVSESVVESTEEEDEGVSEEEKGDPVEAGITQDYLYVLLYGLLTCYSQEEVDDYKAHNRENLGGLDWRPILKEGDSLDIIWGATKDGRDIGVEWVIKVLVTRGKKSSEYLFFIKVSEELGVGIERIDYVKVEE